MAEGIVSRLLNRRDVSAAIVLLERADRGEAHLAGAEEQLAAIFRDRRGLDIALVLVLASFDHDVRTQPLDEVLKRLVQQKCEVDDPDCPHGLDAEGGGHRDAGRLIGIDRDDQEIAVLGREAQQPEMTGVHDIEIAGNKNDSGISARAPTNLLDVITAGAELVHFIPPS